MSLWLRKITSTTVREAEVRASEVWVGKQSEQVGI